MKSGTVRGGRSEIVNTVATNLNDLEFDEAFFVPELEGWYIYRAHSINNRGDIAGLLALVGDPTSTRGCVIEMRPDPEYPSLLPRVHLIPGDEGMLSSTYAVQINDVGIVLGRGDAETAYVYRPPLHGQPGDLDENDVPTVTEIPPAFDAWNDEGYVTNPVGEGPTFVKAYLYATGEILTYNVDDKTWSFTDVSNLDVSQIRKFNDLGGFCGSYNFRGNRVRGFSFDGEFLALDDTSRCYDLNNNGDAIGISGGHPVLFHREDGPLILDDKTVVAKDLVEQAIWDNGGSHFIPALNERNATGFPVVAGIMDSVGYVLFPMTP